jgi:hypothetical protein
MSNVKVCKNCDSNDIEVDRTRGITKKKTNSKFLN